MEVVQNWDLGASVAIIQVNLPNIKQWEAYKYVKCDDICNEIDWLRSDDWQDVHKGFTYCCSIEDFKYFFNYRDIFYDLPQVLNISDLNKTK